MMLKASETGLIPESELALARRKVFAFRRVSVELFGSWLHVKPPHLIGLCISGVNVVQIGSQTM